MRSRVAYLIALPLAFLCAAGVHASEAPVAVSPGDASTLVAVESRCPTFSWGEVEGAKSYEVVVYRVGEEAEGVEAVIRQRISGSASSWTPYLDVCLERGGQYAWSVRALGVEDASAWSAPSLFEVDSGPTEGQLQAALRVVQAYLEEREAAPVRKHESEPPGPMVETVTAATGAATNGSETDTEAPNSTRSAPVPAVPVAPATVSLSTDGALGVGTSLPLADLHIVGGPTLGGLLLAPNAGLNKGSELMLAEDNDGTYGMKLRYDGTSVPNLLEIWGHKNGIDSGPWLTIERDSGRIGAKKWNPDPPCFDAAHRFVDCGNGTVTDSSTSLIYLKNANCFGEQNWTSAKESAAELASGSCGLTDGSRMGDWRLPTKEEWEGIMNTDCTTAPKLVGNQSPNTGCYTDAADFGSEWASDVAWESYWTSTTAAGNTVNAATGVVKHGFVGYTNKSEAKGVWPVRSGQ